MPSPPMPVHLYTETGTTIRIGSVPGRRPIALSFTAPPRTPALNFLTLDEANALILALKSEVAIVERSQQTAKECNHDNSHRNDAVHSPAGTTENEKAKTRQAREAPEQGI